ncbi:hypothetical protein MKX01_011693 [Papaver californicum]|nr:hypothetical protein MKX01_011693 [Papaver californicum]
MEEDGVKVLGVWSSPFVYRVIWALKLKGIEYEYIEEENIYTQKSDLLLKYNPVHKKVPVLVHGGKPFSESMIILEYLEKTWPEKYPLLSKDPCQRSVSRFWSKFIDDQSATFWKFFSSTGEEQVKAIKDILQILRTVEEHSNIRKQKFFGGDRIGLTDLAF